MPTATIAAWLVLPPRAVRMPCASTIPWKSSGVVSSRTRMTSSPALPRRSASSAVKTTAPTAAPGDALTPSGEGLGRPCQVELGQQELAYLVGLDQGQQGVLLAQHALGDQVDGDPGHRLGAALAVARLQHVERTVLDGELHVLHVAVGRLQLVHGADQLRVGLGDLVLQLHERARRADARHHVLALGVDEEVAEGLALLTRHIAPGEGDAGPRVGARVAEDHLLHVDRRAEVVVDAVEAAVVAGAPVVPRLEHRPDRRVELLAGILGEGLAPVLPVDVLEDLDQVAQVVGREVDVLLHPAPALHRRQRLLEVLLRDLGHDVAEHLDEAAVGVVGEAGVVGAGGEALHADVVEPEVEDGVHHPGHRELGAAAHRDQQGVLFVAEALADGLLEGLEVGRDLAREPHGELVVAAQVLDAGLGGDGEALRHGQAEPRHLRDVRALAPEEVAHLAPALGEVVHPLGDHTRAAHRAPPTSVTRSKSATWDRTPAASRTSA